MNLTSEEKKEKGSSWKASGGGTYFIFYNILCRNII